MSELKAEEQDGFLDGLVVGAVIGTVVGSVIASLVISRRFRREQSMPLPVESVPDEPMPPGRLEDARRTLEQKIAELNQAIDETRNRLYVNSPPPGASTPPEALS